jgi:hypothetical protein
MCILLGLLYWNIITMQEPTYIKKILNSLDLSNTVEGRPLPQF